MGHGLQRAFIVSVLQMLAKSKQEKVPMLLLGFEEPEVYQHPLIHDLAHEVLLRTLFVLLPPNTSFT